MAHPNEELARRGYDAFSNGDIDALRPVVADNTIFHEPGRNPVAGDYQGIDQMLGFFGTVAERSGGTFRVTVHDVVANDEHAVGLHLSEGERAGRRLHSQQTLVFHVRDGMVAETWGAPLRPACNRRVLGVELGRAPPTLLDSGSPLP